MVRAAPGIEVTPEMLDLFEAGLKLAAQGYAEIDYDLPDTEERREFSRICKKLEWGLLQMPLHAASIFDASVDGPPPDWVSPGRAMYQDWGLVQQWRRALLDALDARGRRPTAS